MQIDSQLLDLLSTKLVPRPGNVSVDKAGQQTHLVVKRGKAIETMKESGINVVEMEAAALYAFGTTKQKQLVCFAHITNSMAQGGDFEKGLENSSLSSLELVKLNLEILNEATVFKIKWFIMKERRQHWENIYRF